MHSTTKISLTRERLSGLASHALGLRVVDADELADGWFNTIYRLELDDGRSVVIKVSPPPGHPVMRYERDLMQVEVDVLRLLGGVDGVPVPAVLAFDDSREVIDHDYFIMDYVAGEAYSRVRDRLSPEERASIETELGTISARVNAIPGERYGRYLDDRCASGSWADSFTAMIDDVLLDASDTGTALPVPAETILDACLRGRAALDEVATPSLVLWDLHPGNVFVADGRVSGIIDVDRAIWGDPLMEFFFRSFAGASHEFRAAYGVEAGAGQAFGQQAVERREPTTGAHRVWLYDLYLALIMVVECSFRGFEDGHREWASRQLTQVVAAAEPPWIEISR